MKTEIMKSLMWVVWMLAIVSGRHAQAQSVDAFLENSTLKIGVNAGSYGGAIVWFSGSDGANLVNTFDKGREIQQSFYAGDSITAANQSPTWSPWSWNPIMVGDYAGNVSPVLALNKSAGQIYVKTQPLLWDRNNQLSQSHMEQWISLHPTMPNVVTVDCRFTCFRDANDAWGAPAMRDQELPALYFVSTLNTIKAYTGNAPWTNGELATIPNSPSSGTFPWSYYDPTEPWTACVDANGSGVGVYTPIATGFLAGKYGDGVTTNPFDVSTMYVAPLGQYAFEADTVFSYRFYLILDNLPAIREAVYTLRNATETVPPPPTGLAAVSGNQQIRLTWNPSPNATTYHVKRAPGSGGPYTLIASGAATQFTDEGLTNGVPYNYVVSSESSLGQGADSPLVSAAATPTILVPDAGFENPTTATYQYNPTGASWTFDGGSGISRNASAFTSGNPPAPEGFQVAFVQGGNLSISTTLHGFTPGAEYLLTFSAAQRAGYAGQTWNASIAGNVIGSFAPPNTATDYQDYSATFTALSTSGLLAFVGTNLNGGDNTVFIDNVRVVQIAAADPFGSWMTTRYPAIEAPDNAPTADPDNDGIANIVEYVLQGGDPSVSSTGIQPTPDASGENFVFTYYRRAAATGTTQTFEYGTTLSGWTPVAIPGGAGVVVAPNNPISGIDKVAITVAKGANTKLFGRLQIAQSESTPGN
jgi:hypothetical protein